MSTSIALLRGINVSGHKIIKMEELRDLFQRLGFQNVRTYIQSGNVLFESTETAGSLLSETIRQGIQETYGFDVPVMIRTVEEMVSAIANNPFDLSEPEDFKRLYISFLEAMPEEEAREKLRPYEDGVDRLRVIGKEMYILYGINAGRSALSKVPLEKMLGMPFTARNWNTVNKLAAMGRGNLQ